MRAYFEAKGVPDRRTVLEEYLTTNILMDGAGTDEVNIYMLNLVVAASIGETIQCLRTNKIPDLVVKDIAKLGIRKFIKYLNVEQIEFSAYPESNNYDNDFLKDLNTLLTLQTRTD